MSARPRLVLMAVLMVLAAPGAARAQHLFVEPEGGVRFLSSDPSFILANAYEAGGTVGIHLHPRFALVAHADRADHDPDDYSRLLIADGRTVNMTAGIRIFSDELMLYQGMRAYLGLEGGKSVFSYRFTNAAQSFGAPPTDEIEAWVGGIQAGFLQGWDSHVGVGVSGTYRMNFWDKLTKEGADSSNFHGGQFTLQGMLSIRI